MRWILGVAILAALVSGVAAISSLARPEYTQVGCDIDTESDYAVIWMNRTSEVDKPGAHKYGINFQPRGIVVRFPPSYYAPEWTGTDVMLAYPGKGAASGVLTLETRDAAGLRHEQTIGTVQRPCWEAVKKYIHEHVESKGTAVHLSETSGAK